MLLGNTTVVLNGQDNRVSVNTKFEQIRNKDKASHKDYTCAYMYMYNVFPSSIANPIGKYNVHV